MDAYIASVSRAVRSQEIFFDRAMPRVDCQPSFHQTLASAFITVESHLVSTT
jgi:hypothetical protein